MDAGHIEIARTMMELIQYDNGCVNRVEGGPKFPEKWVNKIAFAAEGFFHHNPELLNDTDIENICIGDYDEGQEKYGHLFGYQTLDEVLDAYHNRL